VTRFKPRVGNVKTGQTTGRFTVINPRMSATLMMFYINGQIILEVIREVFFNVSWEGQYYYKR
jgi:hypothetical protein